MEQIEGDREFANSGVPAQAGEKSSGCEGWGCPGSTMNGSTGYVYALGRIDPRFASLAVEKEFARLPGEPKPPDSPTGRHSIKFYPRSGTVDGSGPPGPAPNRRGYCHWRA